MKKTIIYSILIIIIIGCKSDIKNTETAIKIEKGTKITEQPKEVVKKNIKKDTKKTENDILGFWVGYFEKDIKDEYTKNIYVDEGYMWNRENKINISIDNITDSLVIGHSVVAGNNRPFKGIVKNNTFVVREPGDNKYDGEFIFSIIENKLIGKWKAYKKIDIQNRKYSLERKKFKYKPDVLLEKTKEYVDWNKFIEEKEDVEIDEGEFEEWISKEFASATNNIYRINASNKLLKKSDVENLKKGDLIIIRNTIYARHGYSFKNRPLRVFFDAQSWYIPIHSDIKNEFTDVEKKNIQLLLRYEKNALEYYDFFGRG